MLAQSLVRSWTAMKLGRTTSTSGRRRWAVASVLVTFAAITAYAFVAGIHLDDTNTDAKLGAAPFVGRWHWRFGRRSAIAIGVAFIGVIVLPWLVNRARLWLTVAASTLFAILFGWSLAIVDGWSSVIAPIIDPNEYWVGVKRARPFHYFLSSYLDRALYYTVHVRGHPPGMMLLLIGMKYEHLHSPWAAAGLSFVGIASTIVSVVVTVNRLSGPDVARRAAPLLAFVPFALWQVTSADAFYCGVGASAIALASVAATSKSQTAMIISALISGLLAALALHLTYGATTLMTIGLAVVIVGSNRRWLVPFVIGFGSVFLMFRAGGFWWPDGFRATRGHYWAGSAKFRPAWYFFGANLAVLGLAIGVPTVASFAMLPRPSRSRAVGGSQWVVLPIAASLTAVVANLSQMSKGEVERIWLLFMPWLVIAGISLTKRTRSLRLWLALQATAAIVLQAALVSKW